jgi:uncharacterized membrane protein
MIAYVALITCAAGITPALTRPTLPFGVRVPSVRAADPAIVAVRRLHLRLVFLAGVLGAGVSLVVDGLAAVVAVGVVDMALYALAHHRVRTVKRREWWEAEHRHGVTVDITFRTDPVRVPWLWLLPAVAVLVVSIVLDRFVVEQAVVTVVTPLCVLVILRARPDLDAAQPAGSARRYRVYLRGVARLLMLVGAVVNLALLLRSWVGYVPLAVLLLGALVWEIRVGQAGHRLSGDEEDSGVVQRDDDRYWHVAGMVYVNRRDPAVLVHRRVGMVWTLNLGHPVSWGICAVVVVLATTGVLPSRDNLF